MLMVNVWPFVIITVLVAPATTTNEDSESTRVRRWLWKVPPPPPPPPFFVENRRPEGLPGSECGEEIEVTPYFVSLFDRVRNIPYYSAYKVTSAQAADIDRKGYSRKDAPKRFKKPPGGPDVDACYREAIKNDKQKLSRGHMNPSGINNFDIDFLRATYTLINTAPQFVTSNSGDWQIYEGKIRTYAKTCGTRGTLGGTLYLLTGTSNYGLKINRRGKYISIIQDTTIPLPYTRTKFSNEVTLVTPRAVWTAGCCVWKEPGRIYGQRSRAQSFAVMSNNQDDRTLLHQTEMSVAKLEELLRPPKKPKVNLFPGDSNCRSTYNNINLP